jgi:nucleotide-binding universal stress UspA family protein
MNILVGFDGSNASKDALKIAMEHARAFKAKVMAVTSLMGKNESSVAEIENAEKGLEWVQSTLKEGGIDGETHLLVRGVTAGEDIVAFAKEHKAKEIVMGIKRRSKVGKLMFGSTAQFVILNAPCPVVSIK